MSLIPGTHLGAYELLEPIGHGGMGRVFKAYQPTLARQVAIKVLPASIGDEDGLHERFRQEAIATAALRHPNILWVIDFGEINGLLYLVTEYVDGGTLAAKLGRPLPVKEVVRTLGPIAAALDHAHARGVVHRDVKPHNILLWSDGTPVLADFGVAKVVASAKQLTRAGMVVGTPEYMAPEQVIGDPAGPAVDRYALAIVAYEMLKGRVPFIRPTPMAVYLAHAQEPPPALGLADTTLGRALDDVFRTGLAKKPEERFPTALAFISALSEAARSVETAAAPAAPSPQPPPPDAATRLAPPPPLPPAPVGEGVADRTVVASALPREPPRAVPKPAEAAPIRREPARGAALTRRAALRAAAVGVPLAVVAGGWALLSRRAKAQSPSAAATAGQPARPTPGPTPALAVAPTTISASSSSSTETTVARTTSAERAVAAPSPLPTPAPTATTPPVTTPTTVPTATATAAPTATPRADVPRLATARYLHTVARLADGRLLAVGGQGSGGPLASAEVFQPGSAAWTLTGAMAHPRFHHTATLLRNGRLLVVGGQDSEASLLATAELYDPAASRWAPAAALGTARTQHTATLLPDGQVLVAGGQNASTFLNTVERYDPAQNRWRAVAPMRARRQDHAAILLPTGRVLVLGGFGDRDSETTAELYDPAADRWSAAPPLPMGRIGPTATALASGQVLVLGGTNSSAGGTYPLTVDRFDPASGAWSAAGALGAGRVGHTATLLPSGQVLVVAGKSKSGVLAAAERYDAAANSWSAAGQLRAGRWLHAAVLLDDAVVVIGGEGAQGALADAPRYLASPARWTDAT